MTDPHLDDEQLSSLLDAASDSHAHLAGCSACSARMRGLTDARDLVARAAVASLPASVIEALVAGALAASESEVSDAVRPSIPADLDARRRRTRRGPPPNWLLGAAAAIAVLAGVAGVLRSTTSTGTDEVASTALTPDRGAAGDSGGSDGADGLTQQKALASPEAAVDPELVRGDLGDQDDPNQLIRALAGNTTRSATPTDGTAASAQAAGAAPTAAPLQTETFDRTAGGEATAGGTPATPERAQCRSAAERIGAGRLGILESTSLVRWKGQAAEVLVFTLTEPAGGVSRQALVLRRPGCDLLADPRF